MIIARGGHTCMRAGVHACMHGRLRTYLPGDAARELCSMQGGSRCTGSAGLRDLLSRLWEGKATKDTALRAHRV